MSVAGHLSPSGRLLLLRQTLCPSNLTHNCPNVSVYPSTAASTQAADKLAPGSPLAGEAFFITNQQPVPFWGFTGDLLEGLGYGRPRIKLPFGLILFFAMLFEYVIRPLLRPIKELSTDFTVFRCGHRGRGLPGVTACIRWRVHHFLCAQQ